MHAPKLYAVLKFPLRFLIERQFCVDLTGEEEKKFRVRQQDNLLFRQIRLITGDTSEVQRFLIFVNCKGGRSYQKELTELIRKGLWVNGRHFIISERSASMTRASILSFVDEKISGELKERIGMGITFEKTVLSKYYAYRGLMLSSCHCLEDWYPKVVIVPDYYRTIPEQHIRCALDRETIFTDKEGKERTWVQKDMTDTVRDIRINVFDGCGLHHPAITRKVRELLGSSTDPTTILWRAPFIKGVTNEVDYETFFRERGVTEITDIWGVRHGFTEPMILMTESMYKGRPYFEKNGDASDWERYWEQFRNYNHCLGVAKWNYSVEEEALYTRANYQILQDLDLPYEKFAALAKDSVEWAERILSGDLLYTCCFLGIFADGTSERGMYHQAILKNPGMMKEEGVRAYFLSQMKKYLDEMKCGKLWLRSSFKFLVPDPVMMMEHIGGLPVKGCLAEEEFYSFDRCGVYEGERLIERNPHICRSEHVILRGVNTPLLEAYCGRLANTCIINGKSITPQRLNGADYDGDLVLVVDNPIMLEGVDRGAPIVMDVEDKVTAMEEADTPENQEKLILRTMHSLIGETSNCATAYHNKMPKTKEQRGIYNNYVDLLSVINGKAIDYAKTGVLYNIPRNIAKYGRPLPYFMKYAGDYYAGLRKFSNSNSNMNRLCRELEKWEKSVRFQRADGTFDYWVMLDPKIEVPEEIFHQVEEIYLEYCREMQQLAREQAMIRNYDRYEEELSGWISREEAADFEINWAYYQNYYREQCRAVCPDVRVLANIAVLLCYEKYPKKNKKFLWRIAWEGVLQNIQKVPAMFPARDDQGPYEYLGKRYRFAYRSEEEEA